MDVRLIFLMFLLPCVISYVFKHDGGNKIHGGDKKDAVHGGDKRYAVHDGDNEDEDDEDEDDGTGRKAHSLFAWNEHHGLNFEGGDIKRHYIKSSKQGVQQDLTKVPGARWDYYYSGSDGKQYIKIPFVYGESATENVKWAFQEAIDEFEAKTCIRLIERTNEEYYIKVTNQNGCWSYVGRQELQYQPQEISLQDPGCDWKDIAVHEVMHALGYEHEQCRPDRNQYIKVNFKNIPQNVRRNFEIEDTNNQTTPYDFLSVMHYGAYAFTKTGKPTLVRRKKGKDRKILGNENGLSVIDAESLNLAYCHGSGPEVTPTGPEVTPTGPEVTPTGEPSVTPTGPEVTPTGPEVTPTGPTGPGVCYNMLGDNQFCRLVKKGRSMCRYCTVTNLCWDECVDEAPSEDCTWWMEDGDCLTDVEYMSRNCAGTCYFEFCGAAGGTNANKAKREDKMKTKNLTYKRDMKNHKRPAKKDYGRH